MQFDLESIVRAAPVPVPANGPALPVALEGHGPRLIARRELLARIVERPTYVTMITAPAGYGKSALGAQCYMALLDGHQRAVWWPLKDVDRDPRWLLRRLAKKLDGLRLQSAQVSFDLDAPLGDAADAVAEVFAPAPQPVTLFLDDVHVLDNSPSMVLLRELVSRVTSRLRIVMMTRRTLDLPVARLRVQGQLLEIDSEALTLSEVESVELLAQSGCDWPGVWCRELHRRSEGWLAGLLLLQQHLARAERPVSSVERLEQCTGELPSLADYFSEEVLSDVSVPLRDFLAEVSILERVCTGLCEAVSLRSDARALLTTAFDRGLMLKPMDAQRQWFHLHPLFRQFLCRDLRERAPQQFRELHRRASEWAQRERLFVLAFDHAVLAGEVSRAAEIFDGEILESWCVGTFGSPQVEVLTMCGMLPKEVKQRFPRIMLLEAWRRDMLWQFEGSKELLDKTREVLKKMSAEGGADHESLQTLNGLLKHGEAMLTCMIDDMPSTEVQCEELLREYPDANPYLKASFYTWLAAAQREQYKLSGIDRLATLGREYCERAGVGPSTVFIGAMTSLGYFVSGRTELASKQLGVALELAERLGGGASPLSAAVALLLAEVHFERGEIQQAQALIDQYLPLGNVLGIIDQLVAGFTTAARLHMAAGQPKEAELRLQEAIQIARSRDFERLRLAAASELIRVLLTQGRIEDVERVRREHAIRPGPQLLPGKGTTTRDEYLALAWVRSALATNQLSEAHGVIKHWRIFLETAGAVRSLIRWEILSAHHALLSGDARAAQRQLRRALSLALPGRFVRPFLDEGEWMEGLLRRQADHNLGVDMRCDAFTEELLVMFDRSGGDGRKPPVLIEPMEEGDGATGVFGALSPREVEVLALVASGLLNREIGDKLGMTEGSVKWYLQRIYDKLGVRRRSQAMDRAVKMGLLAR